MSAAHTPGPWHWVNPETDQPRQSGEWRASLRTVAEFGENKREEIDGKFYTRFALPKFIVEADEIRDENMEANARLIAAAPDLLEALTKAKSQIAVWRSINGDMVGALSELENECLAAIAKATGQ